MRRPEGAPPRALHAGAAAPDGADGGRSQSSTKCVLPAHLQGAMTMARGAPPPPDGGGGTETTRLEHCDDAGAAGSADPIVIILINLFMSRKLGF